MATQLPAPRDAQDQRLLDDVHTHGWHVVMVPEDESTPGWCFTVGLQHTFGHPELIIFGLPLHVAHALLNIGGKAISNGRTFEIDVPCDGFLKEFACVFRPVRQEWHGPFLGYAAWFYGDGGFNALQLFWPDREGYMPWEDAAAEWLPATQPQLTEADAEHAGLTALLASMEPS